MPCRTIAGAVDETNESALRASFARDHTDLVSDQRAEPNGRDGTIVNAPNRPYRLAIEFAVEGDLRFLAHRDMIRLFQRALVRAQLPVKYSSGFNPRIQLWLPLPRPVGIAACDELLLVALTEAMHPQQVRAALEPQMPNGLRLGQAVAVESKTIPRPLMVEYRLAVDAGLGNALRKTANQVLESDTANVTRHDREAREDKTIDIRPLLETIGIEQDQVVFRVRITPQGTARPRELLSVLNLDPDLHAHRLQRTKVTWAWPDHHSPDDPPKGVGS